MNICGYNVRLLITARMVGKPTKDRNRRREMSGDLYENSGCDALKRTTEDVCQTDNTVQGYWGCSIHPTLGL